MSSETLTFSKTNPVLAAKGLTRRFGGLIAQFKNMRYLD